MESILPNIFPKSLQDSQTRPLDQPVGFIGVMGSGFRVWGCAVGSFEKETMVTHFRDFDRQHCEATMLNRTR